MSRKDENFAEETEEDTLFLDPDEVQQEIVLDGDEGSELPLGSSNLTEDGRTGSDLENEEAFANLDENAAVIDTSLITFDSHKDSVYCVCANPNFTDALCSGGGDDKAFLWSAIDGFVAHELSGHSDSVTSVQFNWDGSLVATGSMDSTVKIWDVKSGDCVQTLEGPADGIEWIDWHGKGNVLLAGAGDSTVWMWITLKGTCMNVFTGHSSAVTCGSFSPDGKSLCTGCEDGSAKVWDPRSAQCLHTFSGHNFHEGPLTCMSFNPVHSIFFSGSQDGLVCLSNFQNGKIVASLRGHEESVESGQFSPHDPNRLATASVDNTARIWDINVEGALFTCEHESSVTKVLWHPTENVLFTASMDCCLRKWDPRTGQIVDVYTGHSKGVLDFALCKNNEGLVSAGDDGLCKIFDH